MRAAIEIKSRAHNLIVNYNFISLTGNYDDSLNDAKVATALQPCHMNAIVRGKIPHFKDMARLFKSWLTLRFLFL